MTDEELHQANNNLLKKRAELQAARTPSEPSAIGDTMRSLNTFQDRLSPVPIRNCECGIELPFHHRGSRCVPCQAIHDGEQRRQAISNALATLTMAMASAGIPPRYCQESWTLPTWAVSYLTSSKGLCLTGASGIGKTATVCLLMREHRRYELTQALSDSSPLILMHWQFVSFPKLVMKLQTVWRKRESEESASDILTSLTKVDRLILDDLGAEKLTDYVRQCTYFLINEREQWNRPTYLTTNFSLKQLDEQLDSRISSRIAGMCDVKALTGHDLRIDRH